MSAIPVGLPVFDSTHWTRDALCAQVGGDEWFPIKGGSTRQQKALCRSCTVTAACLQWAIDNDERVGVWGGLSERERRLLHLHRPHLEAS